MKALLWKDFRLLMDVIWAALALFVASYLLVFLLIYSDSKSGFEWSKVVAGGASLSRFSSILICALAGSYAFAKEKEDKSLLFLQSLPASRARVVLSKSIVAFTAIAIAWLLNMGTMVAGLRAMGVTWETMWLTARAMLDYVAMSAMVFGASWALAQFLGSAVGAAFGGIALLAPACLIQLLWNNFFPVEGPGFFHPLAVVGLFGVSLACLAVGDVVYLRGGIGGEKAAAADDMLTTGAGRLSRKKAGELHVLIWKDLRLVRSSLVVGVLLLALPYLSAIAGGLSGVRTAAVVSIGLSVIVFSFWSGQVMSAELASGCGRFLAQLPARIGAVLCVRLLVTLVPAVILTAVNVSVLLAANNALRGEVRFDRTFQWAQWPDAPFIVLGLGLFNGGLAAYAMAWFLSAHYGRPAVAIVLGVLAGPLIVAVWATVAAYFGEMSTGPSPFNFVCVFTCFIMAAAALLVAVGSHIAANARPYEAESPN